MLLLSSMQDENGTQLYAWAGVWATLTAAIAAIVLFGNMGLAAYYVEKTLSTRSDDIEKMPVDKEVKIKVDAEESFRVAYVKVTKWDSVPLSMRSVLFLAVACMTACCYTVQLFSPECFVPYKLTDTIRVDLHGNWKNLVKPLGWISILLFVISLFLFFIFYMWAKVSNQTF